MSNVLPFKATENLNTVTFRSNEWTYDIVNTKSKYWGRACTDFKVSAKHDRGSEPFKTVRFEIYVDGRQSNELYDLTRDDVVAMRDMFAQIACTMSDD